MRSLLVANEVSMVSLWFIIHIIFSVGSTGPHLRADLCQSLVRTAVDEDWQLKGIRSREDNGSECDEQTDDDSGHQTRHRSLAISER